MPFPARGRVAYGDGVSRVDGRGGAGGGFSGGAGGGFSDTAGRAVWTRVSPAPGQVLDLLHARVTADFAPHVHEPFAIGACTEGTEAIGYRGGVHYSSPGSVVILEPGEPHTGGPAGAAGFVYRVMYPSADLLADEAGRPPRFPRPVVTDPALALELRRVHALLSQGAEPLEAESRLAALLGELVRRHSAPASPAPPPAGTRGAGSIARQVMSRLADQLACPPGLTEIAADAGLSRYQLLRSFRAEVGMPPYAWLAQHRVARARVLLEGGHSPAQAAAATGFADQAHLTRWFRRVVGTTPGAYRNSVQDSARRRG
jgi:AraC-like DNA-binding protein